MTGADRHACAQAFIAQWPTTSIVDMLAAFAEAEVRRARAEERREAFRMGFLANVDPKEPDGWNFNGPAAADREPQAWDAYVKFALRTGGAPTPEGTER